MQILEKVLKSYFNDSITNLSKQTLKKVFFLTNNSEKIAINIRLDKISSSTIQKLL